MCTLIGALAAQQWRDCGDGTYCAELRLHTPLLAPPSLRLCVLATPPRSTSTTDEPPSALSALTALCRQQGEEPLLQALCAGGKALDLPLAAGLAVVAAGGRVEGLGCQRAVCGQDAVFDVHFASAAAARGTSVRALLRGPVAGEGRGGTALELARRLQQQRQQAGSDEAEVACHVAAGDAGRCVGGAAALQRSHTIPSAAFAASTACRGRARTCCVCGPWQSALATARRSARCCVRARLLCRQWRATWRRSGAFYACVREAQRVRRGADWPPRVRQDVPATATAGEPLAMTLIALDALGNRLERGGDAVTATLQPAAQAGADTAPDRAQVLDEGNGCYAITVTPTRAGALKQPSCAQAAAFHAAASPQAPRS